MEGKGLAASIVAGVGGREVVEVGTEPIGRERGAFVRPYEPCNEWMDNALERSKGASVNCNRVEEVHIH